jgi:hypothetical protein
MSARTHRTHELPLLGELTIATLRTVLVRPLSADRVFRAKLRNVARITSPFLLIFESAKRENHRYFGKFCKQISVTNGAPSSAPKPAPKSAWEGVVAVQLSSLPSSGGLLPRSTNWSPPNIPTYRRSRDVVQRFRRHWGMVSILATVLAVLSSRVCFASPGTKAD